MPKYDPSYTRVTLEFAAVDGGCEVTLTHKGVPPEYAEQTPTTRDLPNFTAIKAALAQR